MADRCRHSRQITISRTLKVRGEIIFQANRYLGGFSSSQRIFSPQTIQVLLFLYAWCCSSKDCDHSITAEMVTQKKKGAPAPLPHNEEDCPNAPSAPILG